MRPKSIWQTIGFQIVMATFVVGSHQQAYAQQPPSLVGTWKGDTQVVIIGTNPYRAQEGNGPYFPKEPLEFTYKITDQHDGRFAGTLVAGTGTETVIGALRPPGFTDGILIDDDGHYVFTVRDASTMDLCYHHLYPKSKAVSCFTLRKQ